MKVETEIRLEGVKELELLLKENQEIRERLYENIAKIADVRLNLNAQLKGVEFTSDSEGVRQIENISHQIREQIQEQILKSLD